MVPGSRPSIALTGGAFVRRIFDQFQIGHGGAAKSWTGEKSNEQI